MSSLNYEIRLAKDEASQTRVWEGKASLKGITVQYGISGRKLRAQYIPLAQIPNGDILGLLEESGGRPDEPRLPPLKQRRDHSKPGRCPAGAG